MKKGARNIYMDYAAATPVDPFVFSAMKKYFSIDYGNPGSIHSPGVRAKVAVEVARKEIAKALFCRPQEIIFTSGGTEGDNLALFGVADAWEKNNCGQRGHIIVSAIEHKAVLGPTEELKKRGFEVTYLPVSNAGIVNPADLKKSLKKNTILVSVMCANNEIGTIQPIKELAKIIRCHRSTLNHKSGNNNYPLFHTDACQAPCALSLNTLQLGIDLMTLSGAKVYGPKGVGILYKRMGVNILPQVYGGGQEFGSRSGTENVPYIVGLAKALTLAEGKREEESRRLTILRDYFIKKIKNIFPDVEVNGSETKRLPNNLNFYFPGILGEQLVIELDAIGVEISSGSACNVANSGSSHVVRALGLDNKLGDRANSSVRFSLGRQTTKKDVDFVLKNLPEIVSRIKLGQSICK